MMNFQNTVVKNIQIWNETARLCEEDEGLRTAVSYAKAHTTVYPADATISATDNPWLGDAKSPIRVARGKTFEVAQEYVLSGRKTAVLNFANPDHPGGGVTHGAVAQEEDLCRCSTLYFAIDTEIVHKNYYTPNHNRIAQGDNVLDNALIYTKDVLVFRDDNTFMMLPKEKRFKVDVVTAAAPMLFGEYEGSLSNDALYDAMKSRILHIVNAAAENGAEILILGAFGCGAFGCDAETVARAFRDVLRDETRFAEIVFAIYGRRNRNFEIFSEVLG